MWPCSITPDALLSGPICVHVPFVSLYDKVADHAWIHRTLCPQVTMSYTCPFMSRDVPYVSLYVKVRPICVLICHGTSHMCSYMSITPDARPSDSQSETRKSQILSILWLSIVKKYLFFICIFYTFSILYYIKWLSIVKMLGHWLLRFFFFGRPSVSRWRLIIT